MKFKLPDGLCDHQCMNCKTRRCQEVISSPCKQASQARGFTDFFFSGLAKCGCGYGWNRLEDALDVRGKWGLEAAPKKLLSSEACTSHCNTLHAIQKNPIEYVQQLHHFHPNMFEDSQLSYKFLLRFYL